jgi:hypothetical protein
MERLRRAQERLAHVSQVNCTGVVRTHPIAEATASRKTG